MKVVEEIFDEELNNWLEQIGDYLDIRSDHKEYIKARLELAFDLGFRRGISYCVRRRANVDV